jgi:hypothetical protein
LVTDGGLNVLGKRLQVLRRTKQTQETRIKQARRAGLIDRLLNDANRQGEKTADETPVKEAAPAK